LKYAILIDAGFIKRKMGSHRQPLDILGVNAFVAAVRVHEALRGMQLYRVYWYDAPPLRCRVSKPLRGGQVDFSKTRLGRANERLMTDLGVLPFVSIRRGDLAFRGWKVRQGKLPDHEVQVIVTAAEIEPIVHQKGVDMRLGLDIASLALKAHVEVIVLVTGDSDFVPAMKFARREGVQVFLVTFGHPVRDDMLEHSDLLLNVSGDVTPAAS
jgi:uncharacterized LabA/DUF88 family protein